MRVLRDVKAGIITKRVTKKKAKKNQERGREEKNEISSPSSLRQCKDGYKVITAIIPPERTLHSNALIK